MEGLVPTERYDICTQCHLYCKKGRDICWSCNPERKQKSNEAVKAYYKTPKGKEALKKSVKGWLKRRTQAAQLIKKGLEMQPAPKIIEIPVVEPLIQEEECEEEGEDSSDLDGL